MKRKRPRPKITLTKIKKIARYRFSKRQALFWINCCVIASFTLFLASIYLPTQPAPAKSSTGTKRSVVVPSPYVEGYELTIDKIQAKAPIALDIPGLNEKAYLAALEQGIAHFQDTPYPGQPGNSVLFGHSSYLPQNPGRYKEIFKELNKVVVGDRVTINHQYATLVFEVTKSTIVRDDDFSIMAATENPTLTIITCWPPGTILKRYIIQAKLLP